MQIITLMLLTNGDEFTDECLLSLENGVSLEKMLSSEETVFFTIKQPGLHYLRLPYSPCLIQQLHRLLWRTRQNLK